MTAPADIRLCAYPWDVIGDPKAAERFASTGAGGVAMAAAYHSVRAATPLHPSHRVVNAAAAAVYFPVCASAWAGLRLRPSEGHGWAGHDAFARASETLRAVGMSVESWLVLTHSAAVGSAHPDVAVRNAFGDIYPYALCPSSVDVVEYAAMCVAECARATGTDTMMIEACGPLGLGHQGHHEKTQGADWSEIDNALLSICFCTACETAQTDRGLDIDHLRARVSQAVGRGAITMEAALGDLAEVLLDIRTTARSSLATAVHRAGVENGVTRMNMHVQPDPWATGPFAALEGVAEIADGLVLPGHVALSADDTMLDELRRRARGGRVGGYLNALPPNELTDIEHRWPLVASRLDDVYLYHAGLLSERRLDALTRSIASTIQDPKPHAVGL